MNRISLVNKKLDTSTYDIKVEYTKAINTFDIYKLNIDTLNNNDLYLVLDIDNEKLNVNFNINHDTNLYIYIKGSKAKIKFNYNIISSLNILKYNAIDSINEMIEVNLNKENSNINYIFKSIGRVKENYDYVIHHNKLHTISNITNNCVNKEGTINIQTSGYIKKDITGCICNQNNRIINLCNNKCEIRPNLYIDTDDVDANHSALIGRFNQDEMFYLNSRGINEVDASNLLIKGFLLSNVNNEEIESIIKEDIDNNWR